MFFLHLYCLFLFILLINVLKGVWGLILNVAWLIPNIRNAVTVIGRPCKYKVQCFKI